MNNHRNFAFWDSHVTSYIMNKIYHDIVLYISREILPDQEMKMFDIPSRVSLENNKIYIYQQIIHFSFDLTIFVSNDGLALNLKVIGQCEAKHITYIIQNKSLMMRKE